MIRRMNRYELLGKLLWGIVKDKKRLCVFVAWETFSTGLTVKASSKYQNEANDCKETDLWMIKGGLTQGRKCRMSETHCRKRNIKDEMEEACWTLWSRAVGTEGGVAGAELDESTLNTEVKAGRSGPRVEWSSPGRRWAFLGVHGQLEPLCGGRKEFWKVN